MKQKRLMLLGGIRYLLPVIKAAHEQGYYVITADYLPNNIAHKFSDEYVNVSIIDKEAVLEVAREKEIDGIMSFGVDPGVIAASYVQNQMGLPSFGPFESVKILQNKDKFRAFLTDNGFNVPWAFGFSSESEALESRDKFSYPLIVKPTDSAGSKGCTRVDEPKMLNSALSYAMQYSIAGNIIVEEFIEKQGCSSDSDCFSLDGVLVFHSFNAQHFDLCADNPYTPAAFTWPSTYTEEQKNYLAIEIQRLISLLGLKTVLYNVETRIGINGKPYIMELTPRGGGNRLSEMLRYVAGVDLITAITRSVVGDSISNDFNSVYDGQWAEIILHSDKCGIFKNIEIDSDMQRFVVEKDLWVKSDSVVSSFKGANNSIGTLILKFETKEQMMLALENQRDWLRVIVT